MYNPANTRYCKWTIYTLCRSHAYSNLADITHRSLSILSEVELILWRHAGQYKLLNYYGINTPTKSYHMHNEHRTVDSLVEQLHQGMSMALISDAGTPAISDPDFYSSESV